MLNHVMKILTYPEHRKLTEKRDRVSYKKVRIQKGMDFATSHNPLIAHPKSG